MGQLTPTDDDDFEISGPKHMMSDVIDWNDEEHRRCIAACLVKATYVVEKDEALANPWYESFGFRCNRQFFTSLEDDGDYRTYGAVFELMAPSGPSAPKYVVAFRGTMLFHSNAFKDLVQNTFLVFNALAQYARFRRTHYSVDCLIRECSSGSVWLVGHSLGASLALEIGRTMMLEKGLEIPTFLFNPPHVSPAPVINSVLSEENKTRLYTGSYAFKFVLANILPWYHKRTKELFEKLAPWVPELYVNPDDWICRGYIDYFEQRESVYEDHPRLAKTAARTSYRDMFYPDKSRQHLLPSARLWTSSTQKDAHSLRQWWMSDYDLKLSQKEYDYDSLY